jgi:hypothetical protein
MRTPSSWLLIGLLAGAACAPCRAPNADKLSAPMEERLTREYRACAVDADCVVVLNGCCDCANGGQDIAVNREEAAAFEARFHCTGECNEMAGDCGQGTARCEDQLCTYR